MEQKNYSYYRIADLTVAMRPLERTRSQAEPYRCEAVASPDIVVETNWPELQKRQPHLSDEDCEYLASGAVFYNKMLDFDGMMLHASAVVMDGRAYLFSAPSGTGKSTHTRLWMRVFGDRVMLLNDDKPALRRIDGQWYAYGTPWSGKHDLSVNMRAPIAGICVLRRGETNKIEPFSGFEAIHALMEQTSRIKNGSPESAKILTHLDVLMREIPVWRLTCNMDPEAAILSHRVMSGENE